MTDNPITDEELENALLGTDAAAEDNDGTDDAENTADGTADTNEGQDAGTGDADSKQKTAAEWQKELNDTKSEWGRKTKVLESQVETLTKSVTDLVTAIKSGNINQQNQNDVDDFDEDEPIPLTMSGLADAVDRLLNKRNQNYEQQTTAYENGYLGTVEKLGSEYPDHIHKHIVERMWKQFNIRHSDNPALDAQLNFRNAEAAILREVRQRKTNPLEKNKGVRNQNLGGPTSSSQDTNAVAPVKLDSYAAEFIRATGMKEEDAQKALEGDMPLYLRGKASL